MRKLRPCPVCNTPNRNPKYCSRSCAASINNRQSPKRKRQPKESRCRHCDTIICIGYTERKCCNDCNGNLRDWSLVTYGDFKSTRSVFSAHARVRDLARRAYKRSGKPRHCVACDYRNHFEVCHRIPIASFSDETPVSIINDPDNLVALCPNCHWDFDHDLLIL